MRRALQHANTAIVMIAGVLLLAGCGRDDSVAQQVNPTAQAVGTTVSPAVAVGAPVVSAEDTRESLPPDLEVVPVDTLVSPGEKVEIVVRSTSDASTVTLADGTGETQPLVRDASGDLWRVSYRVPLRPQHERWGLSVTARTDAHRWRRVWVFLRARDGTSEASTSPDTTTTR